MDHASYVADVVWGIFTLLLIAIAILLLARRIRLPFTVLLVPVGIGLNWLHAQMPAALTMLEQLTISPDLILYVFLPTLLFESSYNIDARRLRHNLVPILILAVPGLMLSTGLIGLIVWLATGIPLPAALLLGAILSATDPVAVVALFGQIGASERLTTLVEGESLFNDATAIVLAKILIAILAAGAVSGDMLISGVGEFFVLFFGGMIVGVTLGYITGTIIGWVESEPFVEIGLTTALAYLSFLLAEQVFHVSGVMATVGAGLTIGTWGRIRISSSVRVYLEHFWGMLAFVANALLFLMVGMMVDLNALWASMDILVWVLAAMLLARAVILFGLSPLIGRLPGTQPIGMAFQSVMFWGGLRGAVSLALVLSLSDFEYSELFVALVTGAVLFTLFVQGLTIEPLMHRLGLDVPPLSDRVSFLEHTMAARLHARERLPKLQQGGMFSSRVAQRLMMECDQSIEKAKHDIQRLRLTKMNSSQEVNLLYMRALTEEKAVYSEMYLNGHLSEGSFRELELVLNLQIDALRYHGVFEHVHSHRTRRMLEQAFYRIADATGGWLRPMVERMHMSRIIHDYEQIWGHYQSSAYVLLSLDKQARLESIPDDVVDEVRKKYRGWNKLAEDQLHMVSEQFPEFATAMQERFGKRLILQSELETTHEDAERGILPKSVATDMEADFSRQLAALRGQPMVQLDDSAYSLLRMVPLFGNVDSDSLRKISELTYAVTLQQGEYLVREGAVSDALYLLSRGVIRFVRTEHGVRHELGSLMAGEFFGERALLGHGSIDIAAVAVSPCRLYKLKRETLESFLKSRPELTHSLQERDSFLQAAYSGTEKNDE